MRNSDIDFELAALELRSGNPDTAVLARAYAEANGDAEAAKASYMRLRVKEVRAWRLKQKLSGLFANVMAPVALSFTLVRAILGDRWSLIVWGFVTLGFFLRIHDVRFHFFSKAIQWLIVVITFIFSFLILLMKMK